MIHVLRCVNKDWLSKKSTWRVTGWHLPEVALTTGRTVTKPINATATSRSVAAPEAQRAARGDAAVAMAPVSRPAPEAHRNAVAPMFALFCLESRARCKIFI